MRHNIPATLALLLAFAGVSAPSAAAQVQTQPAPESKPAPELALDYTFLHSNAPPGGCGCFSLNGGGAAFAWPLKKGQFAIVGDGFGAHAENISGPYNELTLTALTGGVRYSPKLGHADPSWRPYGQVSIGIAHASGTLVQVQNPLTTNAGAAFATNIGGGLDYKINPRFSIRIIEAGYLLATFDNGSNHHQNILRAGAGVVVHFGK
jgi:peptidoglycan-associated lipoprotein